MFCFHSQRPVEVLRLKVSHVDGLVLGHVVVAELNVGHADGGRDGVVQQRLEA